MHPNEDALNAYADGTAGAADAADVERHLASCVACRQTVDDLREILRATSDLDLREPPVRAWQRIERAIALDGGARSAGSSGMSARPDADGHSIARRTASRSVAIAWLAAAAALVLAAYVGLRYAPDRREDSSRAAAGGAQGASATAALSVETELRQAEGHYENAIKGLEQIANAEQNTLDPRTAATLQKNLAVIDQAISESRAAVRSQPASEPAQQSLIENFKTKIALLQDTVALINEMRKGNEAGAAQIVSGLKQKGN
jgi:anti-sigma factor ChrR (cupin superfamily)